MIAQHAGKFHFEWNRLIFSERVLSEAAKTTSRLRAGVHKTGSFPMATEFKKLVRFPETRSAKKMTMNGSVTQLAGTMGLTIWKLFQHEKNSKEPENLLFGGRISYPEEEEHSPRSRDQSRNRNH